MDENGVCMTPNCGKKSEWRGLCRSCYGQAKSIIEKEKTTWDELEELGLCKQDNKPFRAAYLAAKKAKSNQ